LLLPVMSRARHSAVSLHCMSNLRQIGQAAFIYAGESRGFFPQSCFENSIVVGMPPQTVHTDDSPYRFSKEQAAMMSRALKGGTRIWYCRANKFAPPPGQRPITEDDFYPP